MPKEDVKLMIELIRHHTLAEYNNELNRSRISLCEENIVAIRKMTTKKGGIEYSEADQFFFDMTIEERSRWFPVQLLPVSMLPTQSSSQEPNNAGNTGSIQFKSYVLLKSSEPAMDLHWQKIQEMTSDIYAYVPPVNQRYLNERLDMPKMLTDFRLGNNHSSSSLKYLTNLARQFSPFLSNACIYSAHRVNMISMLGPELDRLVLDQLPMPYKISERSINPDENFLIESLLEPNKPFVLLVRDFWPTGAWPDNSLWNLQFKDDLESIGLRIIHSWSNGWLLEPEAEMKRVRDEILGFVGASMVGINV